jgi:hypothetical protein
MDFTKRRFAFQPGAFVQITVIEKQTLRVSLRVVRINLHYSVGILFGRLGSKQENIRHNNIAIPRTVMRYSLNSMSAGGLTGGIPGYIFAFIGFQPFAIDKPS